MMKDQDYMLHSLKLKPPNIFFKIFQQRNEAGSSQGMEFLAFQQCMSYLQKQGVTLESLITDRHSSIAKYMREQFTKVSHYFDLWHLRKSKWMDFAVFIFLRIWFMTIYRYIVQYASHFRNSKSSDEDWERKQL